jgi:hypothetical protein
MLPKISVCSARLALTRYIHFISKSPLKMCVINSVDEKLTHGHLNYPVVLPPEKIIKTRRLSSVSNYDFFYKTEEWMDEKKKKKIFLIYPNKVSVRNYLGRG